MELTRLFLENEKANKVIEVLNGDRNVVLTGLSNSRLIFFIASMINRIDRNVLLLAYDNLQIDQYYEDLIRLIPEDKVYIFPEKEALPHEQIVDDLHEMGERLQVLQELITNQENKIIITSATSLLRKLMPAGVFKDYSLRLTLEKEYILTELSEHLSLLGYERVNMVEDPGQYSIRGGILDIFPLNGEYPYRAEFFGDEIDSLRFFDPVTQRSIADLSVAMIPPAREIIIQPDKVKEFLPRIREDYEKTIKKLTGLGNREEAEYLKDKMEESLEKLAELNSFPGYEQFLPYFYLHPGSLLDYFTRDTLVFYDQTEKIYQRLKHFSREIAETQATLLEQGSIVPNYIENFLSMDELLGELQNFKGIFFDDQLKHNPLMNNFEEYSFETRGVEPFHGQVELLADRLKELVKKKYRVVVTLNSNSKARRIAEYLCDKELPAFFDKADIKSGQIIIQPGSLSEGFIIEELKLALYTEKEVFGKPQRKKRQLKELEEGVKITSVNELIPGDYVVHENHGIGKYLGIRTMEIQGKHQDYLVLKYAGEDKLYVPTDQFNLVQKYIGADQNSPKLYKLGGNEWKRVKQKVENSVKEMAIGLLELYAERETIKGYAFSKDTIWQKEFEEAFPYEETPDQLKAIEDVKKDMETPTPMDRLLCGDVGYGKTEVAIRAAFKAAMDGKQTAVLVPTTILAQQHYNTFKDRMENYPIKVEMISRFKTPKEQREILKKLATGDIDIIIGTHRLLSKDIIFHDLGLLVVDEEQRFGVTHKERLKDFKRNVDVLTLTATPIPRTLHMALVGVRDMSVIETPPENRYPIRTYIREFNRELIRDAIRKEMAREGQVYFVHNRVEDIDEKADLIKKLIPDCRVAIAHGQMNEHRLEKLMLDFYNKKYDVLVCTTIIETGLDLPNVNTIIINKAEQMGLAQLYQLRGRVGRSDRIAYAYLLYQKDRILPEIAEKRLRAIKEFTNLGSGFKIAMRDLEIRGAGNLLGPEQHGHIATIGFSLYCKLLESAVEELKGKEEIEENEVEVKLDIDAYIPDNYISDFQQKIEIYKKIMKIRREEHYTDVIDELIDRFGDPPQEVINLITISKLKRKSQELGIDKITQDNKTFNCYFMNNDRVDGKAIFRLLDKYPRKIKVKSGRIPVIGIKGSNLDFLMEVINNLHELSVEKTG
jgi:transcription-repair coupling factor (superfamily II helicase)